MRLTDEQKADLRLQAESAISNGKGVLISPKRLIRLLDEIEALKGALVRCAEEINWDEQNASCHAIGEGAATGVLIALGDFPWDEGQCNETVAKFLAGCRYARGGT